MRQASRLQAALATHTVCLLRVCGLHRPVSSQRLCILTFSFLPASADSSADSPLVLAAHKGALSARPRPAPHSSDPLFPPVPLDKCRAASQSHSPSPTPGALSSRCSICQQSAALVCSFSTIIMSRITRPVAVAMFLLVCLQPLVMSSTHLLVSAGSLITLPLDLFHVKPPHLRIGPLSLLIKEPRPHSRLLLQRL